MKILLTGCAGFIGFHTSLKLLKKKNNIVIGIDNLNNYYDKKLKLSRLNILKKYKNFIFFKLNINHYKKLDKIFYNHNPKYIINLAAQAGVRNSILNPKKYFDYNITGFFNVLELSRVYKIKHLVYASTSSVYGDSNKFPLDEDNTTDKPLSFYAASKKTNEVMAHSYSNIYNLPTTGLRFFTVYGPYGRPDMALFKFIKKIMNNKTIDLYNNGNHFRDFTFIDDVVSGIIKLYNFSPKKKIPYEIYNLGNGKSENLRTLLNLLEKELSKKSLIKKLPLQIGDVKKTHASIKKLHKAVGFYSKTNLKKGVREFVKWYREHYN